MQQIRDHLLALGPRLIAFVAYIERDQQKRVRARFDAGEREPLLAPFIDRNVYSLGLSRDPRFTARFAFVDAWRRHDGYYLVLYQVRD
jgi:hypothetical protein